MYLNSNTSIVLIWYHANDTRIELLIAAEIVTAEKIKKLRKIAQIVSYVDLTGDSRNLNNIKRPINERKRQQS